MSSSPSASSRVPVRSRLLQAAARLFYARGINGVGIDAIITEAGVAKMSLYNNFDSKEDLVLAYIDARHHEWKDLYTARMGEQPTPADGIAAVFDAYLDHASASYEHGFRGCGLLNAAAELPVGSAGRRAVHEHKREIECLLRGHLVATGRAGAEDLAPTIADLLEGAITRAGLEGSPERLKRAKRAAVAMVDAL